MAESHPPKEYYGDYSHCIVPDCKARRADGIVLHQFPDKKKEKARWKLWVSALNLKVEPGRKPEVCGAHFQESAFKSHEGKPRLRKDAVPKQILSAEMHARLEKAKYRDARMAKRAENLNQSCPGFSIADLSIDEINESLVAAVPVTYSNASVQVNTLDLEAEYAKRLRNIIDIKTDVQLTAWTGINNFKILDTIVKAVEMVPASKTFDRLDISKRNLVLLVFLKLKTDLSFRCVSTLFGTTPKSASRYFREFVPLLSDIMRVAIGWQSKEYIKRDLPYYFREHCDVRAVLDCTEVAIQRSTCLHCRILTYSHYKGKETAKYLVSVSPGGVFTYISLGYVGKASDKFIFNDTGLVNFFDEHDAIMVDKGFSIRQELESRNLKLVRPPTLYDEQLSREEAVENQSIAAARVHVERAIQRLKTFQILSGKVEHTLIPFLDDIMIIIAGLTNLSAPILSDDRFL